MNLERTDGTTVLSALQQDAEKRKALICRYANTEVWRTPTQFHDI